MPRLTDAGTYIGSGTWSDVFTYDDRSNLTSRIDARGVKTVYTYNSDPLNRLQSVSWDTTGFGDTANPILPAATVNYSYRTKNSSTDLIDVAQLASVNTTGVSIETYTYGDYEGRVTSKTLTLNSRSDYQFATDYDYDSLDRVKNVTYPKEYGNARKVVHHDCDIASRLTGLTYDSQSFASNIVYNAASQTSSLSVGTGTNQVNESYTYNAQTGLLDNQTATRNGSTLLNLSYDYANANGKRTGQLTKILNNLDHNKDRSYSYDALGRLIQANGGVNGALWTQSYSYDRYGNRTSVSATGYSARNVNADPGSAGVSQRVQGSSPTVREASAAMQEGADRSELAVAPGASGIVRPADPKVVLPTDLLAWNRNVELPEALRPKDSRPLDDSSTPLFRPPARAANNTNPSLPQGNGYTYRRTITIDHSKVPNTDQSNFPVLISGTYPYLTTTTNGGNVQSANGYDVIFTSDSGCATKLNHEVESYNATTGAANYWVKLPTVSHTSDTSFYLCYGNSSVTTDQSNKTAVWDSNYKGVYHMSDNAANPTVADSTANASVGTNAANTNGKSVAGQIGNGLNYNGGSDGTATSVIPSKTFTWECWFKLTDWTTQPGSSNYSTLMGTNYSGATDWVLWMIWKDSAFVVQFASDNGGGITTGNNSISPGSWHQAAYSRSGDNGTYSLYLDGVLKGQVAGGVANVTNPITFATRSDYSAQAFNGVLDEARISNSARSADWIKTEYNNQNSPATFYSISAASGNLPPVANAGGPYSGLSQTSIQFNGGGSSDPDGTIASYAWDFGDHTTGTGVTPTHSYSLSGMYPVTLTVTDNSGATASATATATATNRAPVANAGGPYSGLSQTSIQFNGSGSSDPDGTITSYAWNFGDPNDTTAGAGVSPTHTYSRSGTYTVTLTVTDNSGTQASANANCSVNAVPIPTDGWTNISYNETNNQITTAGFAYDAAGNQVRALAQSGGSQRFQYDAANRLVKVKNDSGTTIAMYTYGDSNERLISQDGDENSNYRTYYVGGGGSVIAEYTETPSSPTTPQWSKSYVYLGNRLLSTLTPNGSGGEAVEFDHPDRLGTRLITNPATGSASEQVTLPFGTALAAESSGTPSNRRFTSYDRSATTGLDYAVNRHYDPQQGRFTQVDPAGMSATSLGSPQSFNLYSYCRNDPINRVDPDGLGILSFIAKIYRAVKKILKWVAIVVVVAFVVVLMFAVLNLPGAQLLANIFLKDSVYC